MANTFAPNGFVPVRRLDGAAWIGSQTAYKIASDVAHDFYAGDPVIRLNTGYIDVNASYPTQGVLGIFVGCEYLASNGQTVWSNHFTHGSNASGAIVTAYVIDDPNVVMRVQVGASGPVAGGPVTFAQTGDNIAYAYGSPSTLSGISGAYADYGTILDTNTLPFTVLGQVTSPPGVNGTDITTAGNWIEVSFNQQAFRVGTTGSAAS